MNRQFTPPSAPLVGIAGRRYNGAAQALHWLTALLMFAVLPLAWVMVAVTRDNPSRDALFTLHKSIGMTILALTIVRLVWRAPIRFRLSPQDSRDGKPCRPSSAIGCSISSCS